MMRLTHSEYNEFVVRFDCAANEGPGRSAMIEIEAPSGDLAANAFIPDAEAVRAADWLQIYRTEQEVHAAMNQGSAEPDGHYPLEITVLTEPASRDATPWTFESHRRNCPRCGRRIMKAATLCGYCWTRLQPEDETYEMLREDIGPVIPEMGAGFDATPRQPCVNCGSMIAMDAALCGFCWKRTLLSHGKSS